MNALKVVYLLVLAIGLFALRDPWAIGALLALQFMLWTVSRLPTQALLRATRRLWLFFAIIFVSYWFMDGRDGLALAAVMCVRVLTLVLASAWVQHSSAPGALAAGFRALRIPESVALTVDATLALLSGQQGRGGGGGGGHGGGGKHALEASLSWRDVRAGRLEWVTALVERSLRRAREWLGARYPALTPARLDDLTIIVAVSLTIMGLKVLQVLPGLPIASGHKNLLIVPLLLLAARATHMRFGGLAAGTAVGIVSFMLGYGKYGVLEIAHFAVPGLLADLLMPFLRAQRGAALVAQYAVAGVVLGAGRFAANLLVITLAGAPPLAFVFFAPMLASQVIFGALSCLVSAAIVRNNLFGER